MTSATATDWRCPSCGAQGTYRYAAGVAWCTSCHGDADQPTHEQDGVA